MKIIIVCNHEKTHEYDVYDPFVTFALLDWIDSIDGEIITEAEKKADRIIRDIMSCLELYAAWRG